MTPAPADVVQRLVRATNDHDLDGIVGCFAADYVNETPAHPDRGFRGNGQVRRNWTQILGGVPDLGVEVLATATHGSAVWSEWRMSGTRRDGVPHELRGVIVFDVDGPLITAARFYVEPVERASGTVDDAVRRTVGDAAPAGATP